MDTDSFLVIREEIKKVLKGKKIHYGTLARQMGISESGIKKMLNGKDLSYNKICRILNAADIKSSDFFKILEEAAPVKKTLNKKQQEYFYKNPNTYHFFYQLLELNLDVKKLKERHGLAQKSIEKYLFALDKIGAIELHPGNVIKSEYYGNCRLTFGMPLVKKVVDQKHKNLLDFAHIPNDGFRGRKSLDSGTLNLTPSSATEFIQDLKELVNQYMNRSQRESITQNILAREDIGFLIVVTPTEGMPHEVIPNI